MKEEAIPRPLKRGENSRLKWELDKILESLDQRWLFVGKIGPIFAPGAMK